VEASMVGGEESQEAMVARVVNWIGYPMLKGM